MKRRRTVLVLIALANLLVLVGSAVQGIRSINTRDYVRLSIGATIFCFDSGSGGFETAHLQTTGRRTGDPFVQFKHTSRANDSGKLSHDFYCTSYSNPGIGVASLHAVAMPFWFPLTLSLVGLLVAARRLRGARAATPASVPDATPVLA